ncbi:MAG: Mpo1-like protein [Luteibaculum sp.]
MERIKSFKEFYPYYLSEHQNTTSRILHFIGTGLFFATLIYCIVMVDFGWIWLGPIFGYGFAWFGHFFFEKNKPATFKYPLWSLGSDFKLFFRILAGKEGFKA